MAKKRTIKQEKLLKFIAENLGKVGKMKTMYNMMIDAGYAKTTAREQSRILSGKGIKEGTRPIVEKLKEERDAAIAEMGKKRPKAKYRDLTDSVDKMTKNIQLLSGEETERAKMIILNDEEDSENRED